jgi:hypothetical protein
VQALYDAVKSPEKLMFCLDDAGHSPVREVTAKTVHHISKQWFKNGKVYGHKTGSYFRDAYGELTELT